MAYKNNDPTLNRGAGTDRPDTDLEQAMWDAPDEATANQILKIAAQRHAARQGKSAAMVTPQRSRNRESAFPYPDLERAMWNAPDAATANHILRICRDRNIARMKKQQASRPTTRAYDPRGERGPIHGKPMATVPTIDRQGNVHQVPNDQLPEALRAGHVLATPMTHPDGTHCYVRNSKVNDALRQGFSLGHKSAGDDDNAPDMDANDVGPDSVSAQDGMNDQNDLDTQSGVPDSADSQTADPMDVGHENAPAYSSSEDSDMMNALSGWSSPAVDLSSPSVGQEDDVESTLYPASATVGIPPGASFADNFSMSPSDSEQEDTEDESSQGVTGVSYQHPTLIMNDAGETFYGTGDEDDGVSRQDFSPDSDEDSQAGAGAQLLPVAYGLMEQNGKASKGKQNTSVSLPPGTRMTNPVSKDIKQPTTLEDIEDLLQRGYQITSLPDDPGAANRIQSLLGSWNKSGKSNDPWGIVPPAYMQREERRKAAEALMAGGNAPSADQHSWGTTCDLCEFFPKPVQEAIYAHEGMHKQQLHTVKGWTQRYSGQRGWATLEVEAFKAELAVEDKYIQQYEQLEQSGKIDDYGSMTLNILRKMKDQALGVITTPKTTLNRMSGIRRMDCLSINSPARRLVCRF